MTDGLRVILEIGKKRRVVAGAMEWPGLDRVGQVRGRRAGQAVVLPAALRGGRRASRPGELVQAVERDRGGRARARIELDRLLGRRPRPLGDRARGAVSEGAGATARPAQACWAYFDDVADRVSEQLALGPRGGGRSRDEIIRHVYASERHNYLAQGRDSRGGWRPPHPGGARRISAEVSGCNPRLQRRGQARAAAHRSSSSSAARLSM